jgi:hypothetical protein
MTNRSAARVVGILFILATVPFSISVVVLEPILASPDFLARVAENPGRVGLGVLLEMVNHLAVVCIAVVIFPVLKSFSERIALGYVVARSIEATLFAIATLHLLTLAFVSGKTGGAAPELSVQLMADVLLAGHDWNAAVLPFTAFGLGALVLNYALYRARLVPRWIAVFGLLSAASILSARLLLIMGVRLAPSTVVAMDGPIFLQEMVFAAWLIFRGFRVVHEMPSG